MTPACWVCGRPLDGADSYIGWDGTGWTLAEAGTVPGARSTHLECAPDPRTGAPVTAQDEAALNAGFNPWKTRREMALLRDKEVG